MKRINKHNRYGYKVGYWENENGSRLFVYEFKDWTYKEAVKTLLMFKQYRDGKREWQIRPIRYSEYAKGIWRENPF